MSLSLREDEEEAFPPQDALPDYYLLLANRNRNFTPPRSPQPNRPTNMAFYGAYAQVIRGQPPVRPQSPPPPKELDELFDPREEKGNGSEFFDTLSTELPRESDWQDATPAAPELARPTIPEHLKKPEVRHISHKDFEDFARDVTPSPQSEPARDQPKKKKGFFNF